jgi:hypothetical protein
LQIRNDAYTKLLPHWSLRLKIAFLACPRHHRQRGLDTLHEAGAHILALPEYDALQRLA